MAAMQFWGVEVKGNKPCKVKVEEGLVIHLSQATLGELKKDSEPVTVHVKVDDKKLVLGILNAGNNPQLAFDLVFDTDFEISHNWKNGSVHLLGYQSEMPDDEDISDFSDDEEDVPIPQKENGKPAAAVTIAAPKAAAKLNKDNKPKPEEKSEDESDDSDEEDSDDDSEGAEDMSMGDASDDDEDDSDDDEDDSDDDEPAKPAESGKKRPNAEAKTPQSKKAKLATPQKTDGKKGGHDATPHPSKKGGKTPASEKSPKSGAQVSCGSCKKTFNSENALQSHAKAKHAGK